MQVILRSVTKYYGDGHGGVRPVLQDINREISSGAISFINGRSGSGKSTLLNLIAGLIIPDSGDVIVGDISLGKLSESGRDRFRAGSIGYIFQSFNLFSPLTVLENVFVPDILAGRKIKDCRKKALDILAEMGLAEHADKLPYQLSVGQRQRVAAARVIFSEPKVILADEPTASLDNDTSLIVKNAILGLNKKGSTLLIATHDPVLKDLSPDIIIDVEKSQ